LRAAEYHIDGFRFDLASILTRAPSTWHPTHHSVEGQEVGLHSGGAAVDESGACGGGAGGTRGRGAVRWRERRI